MYGSKTQLVNNKGLKYAWEKANSKNNDSLSSQWLVPLLSGDSESSVSSESR